MFEITCKKYYLHRVRARQNCAEEWLHHKAQYMIVSDDQKIPMHYNTYVKNKCPNYGQNFIDIYVCGVQIQNL